MRFDSQTNRASLGLHKNEIFIGESGQNTFFRV